MAGLMRVGPLGAMWCDGGLGFAVAGG